MANQSHKVIEFEPESTGLEDYYEEYDYEELLAFQKIYDAVLYSFAYLNCSVFCFGFLSNIIVLLVFDKDGLNSPSNISLFSLGMIDFIICTDALFWLLMSLFPSLCTGLCYRIERFYLDYIRPSDEPLVSMGAWITAVITLERLCCIRFPMKVSLIITPKRIGFVILGFAVFQVMVIAAKAACAVIKKKIISDDGKRWSPYPKMPWFRILIPSAREKLDLIVVIDRSIDMIAVRVLKGVLFGVVVIATILLIVLFKRSFEKKISMTGNKDSKMSVKEVKVIKSVVAVCAVYIITFTPEVIYASVEFFFVRYDVLSDFDFDIKTFYIHELVLLLRTVNHSINIFVYLAVNSNFKKIFMGMFCPKCKLPKMCVTSK